MIPSWQELLVLGIIIFVLYHTGLWPVVMRTWNELRGRPAEDMAGAASPPTSSSKELDLCYRLMGLSPSASWEEIEKAYRRKAKVHHPDHGGDDDTMRALNEAYQRLKQVRKPR